MRILWVSNAPDMPTGYGNQTAIFVPRLREAGHEVAIFGLAGCEGAPREWNGFKIYPRAADPWGNDIVLGHADHFKADLIFTLMDPHVFDPNVYGRKPWCAWTPVDGDPLQIATRNVLKHENGPRWVWVMSDYGRRQFPLTNPTYVPHGVDHKVFCIRDREESRKALGLPLDAYIVLMVAANNSRPSRKGFFEAFSAFRIFAESNKKALLYVHSIASGVFGGEDLPMVANTVGHMPIRYAPQYEYVCGLLGSDHMVSLYSAADVYLSASHGEGFGIPVVEAGMCGLQSIVPLNSAQSEVALVGRKATVNRYMHIEGTLWGRPRIIALAEELSYELLKYTKEAIRNIFIEKFSADYVFDRYMQSAFQQIEAELRDSRAAMFGHHLAHERVQKI